MKMANLQGMDNIFGAMEAFSKEILLMAWDMARVFGKKGQEIRIVTKDFIVTIKNGEKEFLFGKKGIFTKGIIKEIREMDLVLWNGPTAVIIEGIGLMEYNMVRVIVF